MMNKTKITIVTARGISPIEFDVFNAVDLHGQLARTRVATYAVFLDSARPKQSFTLLEYEAAVEACINKGWLKVLTAQDCQQDRLRWQNDLNQCCGETEYRVGNVDFTEDGASLYYGICAEIDVAEGDRPYHSRCCYAWNVAGQVRVFGAYEDEVKQTVEAIRTGKEQLGSESFQIERIEPPIPIGSWWLNRFAQLPEGYRSDIYYTTDDGATKEKAERLLRPSDTERNSEKARSVHPSNW